MRRIAFLVMVALPVWGARTIAVVSDAAGSYGVKRLEAAIAAKGFTVGEKGDFVVLAGGPALAALKSWKAPAPVGAEALTVWRGRYQGKPAIALAGGDGHGLMFAALEAAERISWSAGDDPFQYIRDTSEKPYLAERAISMYTMQRAYFESKLYDERYWTRYFDMLAADRINSFVVIFGYENGGFMAPLYPYFFNVQGFPQVELVGITAEGQAKNTAAFKKMIALAHERGIEVTAGIWDHIYRGGVQGGGIPGASQNAGKRVPGLVFGVTADNLAGYTKAALRRFVEVFPEIDAIQFRMHDESGLKKDEMQPFWHEVFASIKKDHPALRLDLRAKELPDAIINDALDLGLKANVSTKYWMEQMGLPFHPTHTNLENQHDRRHGYADLLRYPQRYRVHWQVWSGGTTRLLLWGDPDYVRRFAETARLYDGNSFEINEMLATWMLGEPHDEKPLDVLNPRYRYFDYEFERYWDFYRLWGRLTYNPQATADVWEHEFGARFGAQAGPHAMAGLQLASRVLPRIVAASYLYKNFPTTRGWAEMNRQGSLPEFAGEEGSDVQQFMNVREEAKSLIGVCNPGVECGDTAMRRPEETSRWFAKTADGILAEVAAAEKAAGERPENEFRSTMTDLKILAGLARYHSWRLLAGVAYSLYKESHDIRDFDESIGYERKAIGAWGQIVEAAGDVYSRNLAFGAHAVGFSRHWQEEYEILNRNLEALLPERQKAMPGDAVLAHRAMGSGDIAPPVVKLLPVAAATPRQGLDVSVKVTAPAGLKWARLRYRHLTQYEDYQTAAMAYHPETGVYTGNIPGSFVVPEWDLMYFVEAVGKDGAGRMYPDLESEKRLTWWFRSGGRSFQKARSISVFEPPISAREQS